MTGAKVSPYVITRQFNRPHSVADTAEALLHAYGKTSQLGSTGIGRSLPYCMVIGAYERQNHTTDYTQIVYSMLMCMSGQLGSLGVHPGVFHVNHTQTGCL